MRYLLPSDPGELGIKLGSHLETALTGSIQRAPEYQEVSAGLVLKVTAP